MKAMELVCGSCGVTMRLSEKLISRVWGHAGRVTCKACGVKIELDARGDELLVLTDGRLVEVVKQDQLESAPNSSPLERAQQTEASAEPSGESDEGEETPHFSEYPEAVAPSEHAASADGASMEGAPQDDGEADEPTPVSLRPAEGRISLAPPIPEELKRRRAMSKATSGSAEASANPMQEAPVPDLRETGDSLTPHTFNDEAVASERIRLPREFNSSPMSSNARDETFRSLYPPAMGVHSSGEESELARQNRLRGPHPPHEGLHRPSRIDSVRPLVEADLLAPAIEKEEKSSNWAPWALAAAACLGLIFNVMMGPRDRGLSGAIYGLLGMSESPTSDERPASDAPVEAAAMQGAPDAAPEPAPAEAEVPETGSGAAEPSALSNEPAASSIASEQTKSNAEQNKSKESIPPAPVAAPTSIKVASQPVKDSSETGAEEDAVVADPVEAIPFSPAAAALAMRNAASVASSCRKPGDPSGEAQITITFASSGKVTQALLSGPPFAGTATGSCIAAQFRNAEVPPFSGQRVTVTKTVTIR